jgi:hypothetical protein
LNDQWQNAIAYTEPFTPGQPSISLANLHGITGEFDFISPGVNLGLLITPAHPLWVSRPSVLTYTPTTDDTIDPLLFRADPPVLIGEQYVVHAAIYKPFVYLLQNAGESYPAWVQDNYLQLPENLSPRITELARNITTTAKTPYDMAVAITNYLRSTITYSATVDAPPDGTDPLVWFLFDSRKGFCNYYATAEVILLRSVGVPTRMVVGFAEGENEPPNTYIVREKDAHAWPEVYFPGIGWVEFEPTSIQPVLNRPLGYPTPSLEPSAATQNAIQSSQGILPTPTREAGGGFGIGGLSGNLQPLLLFFGLLVVMIVAGVALYKTGFQDKNFRRALSVFQRPFPIVLLDLSNSLAITPPGFLRRWAYIAGLKPIERSFGVIFQCLRWLGAMPSPARTPAEAAAALIGYMPMIENETRLLQREYEHYLFSLRHTDQATARWAGQTIRRQALLMVIRQRVNAFWDGLLRRSSRKTL